MAYFDVSINASPFAVAGSPDMRVLTVGALVTSSGSASLSITGKAVADHQRTHFFWPSHELSPGDKVLIRVLMEARATPPVSTRTVSELALKDELARLNAENAQLFPHQASRVERPSYSHTRAPQRGGFRVVKSSGASVKVELGHFAHLQAVVCLRRGGCQLEIDAFADAESAGHRWLSEAVEFNQSVTISYAA